MPQISSITCFNALPPTLVRTIHEAFDDAVVVLERNWARGSDSDRAVLARHIVDLAKHGECDASRLRDGALAAIHLGEVHEA
jgi:hypothetical protein